MGNKRGSTGVNSPAKQPGGFGSNGPQVSSKLAAHEKHLNTSRNGTHNQNFCRNPRNCRPLPTEHSRRIGSNPIGAENKFGRRKNYYVTANAKNPERVFDKARECHFFLVQMADCEKALDAEKFLYNLSAFMSAFRTAANRLCGVTENKRGEAASRILRSQLHHHPEIGFLLGRSNVEVHEDGVVVHQRYTVHVTTSVPDRWEPIWQPESKSRFSDVVGIRRAAGWQFLGNPKNLIELCYEALAAIEEYARQALVTVG